MLGRSTWRGSGSMPAPFSDLGYEIWDDFFKADYHATVHTARWLRTSSGAPGTPTVRDEAGGIVRDTTGSSAGNFLQWRLPGEPVKPGLNTQIEVYGRFRFQDLANIIFGFGLTTSGDDKLAPSGSPQAVTFNGLHGALFATQSSDGIIYTHTGDGIDEDTLVSSVTLANDTWYDFAIVLEPTVDRESVQATFYINGAKIRTTKLYVPLTELTVFFNVETDNAAAETFDVDRVGVLQSTLDAAV